MLSPSDPELQLIACMSRTQITDAARDRAGVLLQRPINWERFRMLARRHRVFPLLSRHLPDFEDRIPKTVQEELRHRTRKQAAHILVRMRALLEILTLLEAYDVPVLSFKGPVLGTLAYGDVVMRPFGDLDLWIPREDAHRVRALLVSMGYEDPREEPGDALQERLRKAKSYELIRSDDTLVELHWDFLHPMHGPFLDPAEVWSRSVVSRVSGQSVRTLSPEDRVLYLCAHGSKHFWENLSPVCDVAESLRAHRDVLDWSLLLRRAETLRAERMLRVGLLLATHLLDAQLPAFVRRQIGQDAAAANLAEQALHRMSHGRTSEELTPDDARFHLKMREHLRDRLPYYRQLSRLAVEPTPKDRDWVELRPSLHFAYYLIRPIRLLRNGLARLFGQPQATL